MADNRHKVPGLLSLEEEQQWVKKHAAIKPQQQAASRGW